MGSRTSATDDSPIPRLSRRRFTTSITRSSRKCLSRRLTGSFFDPRSDLIHEAFVGKRVLQAQRRAEWAREEGGIDLMRKHALTPNVAGAGALIAHATSKVRGNCVAAIANLFFRGG